MKQLCFSQLEIRSKRYWYRITRQQFWPYVTNKQYFNAFKTRLLYTAYKQLIEWNLINYNVVYCWFRWSYFYIFAVGCSEIFYTLFVLTKFLFCIYNNYSFVLFFFFFFGKVCYFLNVRIISNIFLERK